MRLRFPRTILFFILLTIFLCGCTASSSQTTDSSTPALAVKSGAAINTSGAIYEQPSGTSSILLASSWSSPDGNALDEYAWDNFTLTSTATINEVHWRGGYNPLAFGSGGPVQDFTVAIYPSIPAGTQPDVNNPLVQYQVGGNAGEIPAGIVGNTAMYDYAFILPADFVATGGVKYWIQIYAWQRQFYNPDWGLQRGTGGDGWYFRKFHCGDIGYCFQLFQADAAFSLWGPRPTDIFLSNATVDENQPSNTIVGTLSATDTNPNATFTFDLACAVPGADDGAFNINGADLKTNAPFDFESKNIYNLCVRVTDQGGISFDKDFVVNVNDVNEAPTDILLSNDIVDEHQPANTIVGGLTTIDPDFGDVFTFDLQCAIPGLDDSSFNINGTDLQTSASFDFVTQSVYNICIRVTDQGGLFFDKNFVITVNPVNPTTTPTDTATATVAPTDTVTPLPTDTATATATPTDTPTPTPTDTATPSPTDTATATATPTDTVTPSPTDTTTATATPTDTATPTPTDTATITPSPTDTATATATPTDTATPTPTDTATATVTPTPLPNVPGKVTGGGNIDLPNGKATFGFVVRYDAGDASPSGNLTFIDHFLKMKLKADSFTLLYIHGNQAIIKGYAMVNDDSTVLFTLELSDDSNMFLLRIPELNGYSAGGQLSGGNIQISTP